MRNQITTLCYIEKENSYLMLHRVKKEKDVNKDKWIGIGGHLEDGESPEECLVREVYEETGLKLSAYTFRGLVTFVTTDGLTEYMCLYTGRIESEEEALACLRKDCPEGNLEWVKKSKFPCMNLWEGDYIFLQLLEEKNSFFSLKLKYDGNTLIEASLDGNSIDIEQEVERCKQAMKKI